MLDRHFYHADEIKVLLNHYIISKHPNVDYMCDIDAMTPGVLHYNMAQELEQRIMNVSKNKNYIDTIIIPINLGNHHWTALHLNFKKNQRLPFVRYVDPIGADIPPQVRNAVTIVYPGVIKNDIDVSIKKIQKDGYNCGPWTIAILESIVKTDEIPPDDFDIGERRKQDTLIWNQTILARQQTRTNSTQKGEKSVGNTAADSDTKKSGRTSTEDFISDILRLTFYGLLFLTAYPIYTFFRSPDKPSSTTARMNKAMPMLTPHSNVQSPRDQATTAAQVQPYSTHKIAMNDTIPDYLSEFSRRKIK